MSSQMSRQDPDAELQAAFRRHLPQRLHTLMRRGRAQCRGGWDCNVLRALHDEITLLAGVCGRYGMLEIGGRLLALEAELKPAVESQHLPNATATARIDGLLDGLRPYLQQVSHAPGSSAWQQSETPSVARAPFPRCEMPPPGYRVQTGSAGTQPPAAPTDAANDAAKAPGVHAPAPKPARGPSVRIVNDDDILVSELVLKLDGQGCDAELLDDPEALVELLRREPPELSVLIADARTPFDRIAAALHEVRHDPAHRVRLLVLLRASDVSLRLHALRAGADRCLALPATAADVAAAVLELVGSGKDDPYRVLIVDDDAAQALFAQAILKRAGMQTRILGDALAVLGELDHFQPDLLLLDLNMPGCDGFELTALIREREGYVSLPIVFLSGELDEERQFAALDAGGDDFLMKPIRPAHLTAAVANRIRRARAATRHARRRRDASAGMQTRARLLDALSEHFAAAVGRAATGGLVAMRLHEGEALRDSLGAPAFEQLLAEVGAFIVGHAREDVVVAQHEVAGYLLFASAGGERELLVLARGLLSSVADQRFGASAQALRLDSAVCAFGNRINEPAAALAAIEQALAAAAPAAGDEVSRYAPAGGHADALSTRITAALSTSAFGLAFQPILPVRGAAPPHYQALLRLRAEEHEYTAAELVPAAIRMGAIAAVDAWVVGRCINILAQRAADGDNLCLVASQSLSGWHESARCARLSDRLSQAAIPADRLILEFRCEEARGRLQALSDLLTAFAQLGVRVALAGFDAQAAAAGWIDHLHLDYVKLDPDIAEADLQGVVHAAHACNLRVIAPRVETQAQAEALRLAGVDMLQGNGLQPPVATLAPPVPKDAT